MNFKRRRADSTDATDVTGNEDELQEIAGKMNFKRRQRRHNRPHGQHPVKSGNCTSRAGIAMKMNFKRKRGRHNRRTNITGDGAGNEHSGHAVKMNFKRTWADATDATGNTSA